MNRIDNYLTITFPIENSYFINLIDNGTEVEKEYANLMYAYHLIKTEGVIKARLHFDSISGLKENEVTYMLQALLKHVDGDREEALVKFKKAYAYNSKNKWLNLELYYYFLENDDVMAWKYLEDAIQIDKNFSKALIAKAVYLDPVDNCEEIIKDLNRIPESYKDYQVSYLLGIAYLNHGDLTKSLELLQKSIAIKETSNAYLSLGVLFSDYLDDTKEANYYFIKSLEIEPDNIFAINNYAWFLYNLGDTSGSETYFLSLLELNKDQEIYNQVIQFYLNIKDFKSAELKIQESVDENGINFMNDGFKIILKSLTGDEYINLNRDFKNNNGEFELDWLKSMIIKYHNEGEW